MKSSQDPHSMRPLQKPISNHSNRNGNPVPSIELIKQNDDIGEETSDEAIGRRPDKKDLTLQNHKLNPFGLETLSPPPM